MGSPLETPLYRYGIGLGGAAVLAFVAFVYLDGTLRWLVLAVAVVDAVVTPTVLKRAAT